MKRSIIIIIISISIVWVSVLTIALTRTSKTLDAVKAELTRSIYYDLRELEDALNLLLSSHEGNSTATDAHLSEGIHRSLGNLETSYNTADAIYDLDADRAHNMLGNIDFISKCMSAWYSADINGVRLEGVLKDGELSDNEVEYVKLLLAEVSELRLSMALGDRLNFNPDVSLDEVFPMLVELVEEFGLGYSWDASDMPIRLLMDF